ncbi:MAG TPA: hypothetical protein DCZ95_17860 [Verrucomicrobia bacterium]|nr:MAG: hypothetical protein A2X46_07545 [Lentisphaerae bacterium GWF2_57_35]HBA85953.1 hypothetical protein [Verrucomicrobiota bacterium]
MPNNNLMMGMKMKKLFHNFLIYSARFILHGQQQRIGLFRVIYLSTNKNYTWISRQENSLKRALEIFQQERVKLFGDEVRTQIKAMVFIDSMKMNARFMSDFLLIRYHSDYTDNYLYLSSLLVKFAFAMKYYKANDHHDMKDSIAQGKEKQIEYLKSFSEGGAMLAWVQQQGRG